jgi:thiamine biosynthesis lipoprotein
MKDANVSCRLRFTVTVFFVLLCICVSCSRPKEVHLITGKTMGTTYHITVVKETGADLTGLQARIDQRLESLNRSMSTYRQDSEISRFNRFQLVDHAFPVSEDFYTVMALAFEIYQISGGAWDGTVHPLVNLWGFGASGTRDTIPARHIIAQTLNAVGFSLIDVSDIGVLKKRRSGISIDLASIAKGYGVDAVARLLGGMGFENYLVEIGGEVYAAGRRPDGTPWKVGINRPEKTAPANAVYKVLTLENQAMATSGDYRNYIEIEGRTFSHIIDPRSGYPVHNGVVSASVFAPACTLADGLATAIMVMGADDGLALMNRLDKVEGLIVVREPDGGLHDYWSSGMVSINP